MVWLWGNYWVGSSWKTIGMAPSDTPRQWAALRVTLSRIGDGAPIVTRCLSATPNGNGRRYQSDNNTITGCVAVGTKFLLSTIRLHDCHWRILYPLSAHLGLDAGTIPSVNCLVSLCCAKLKSRASICLMETPGCDVTIFHYVNHFFDGNSNHSSMTTSPYRKLPLYFTKSTTSNFFS